MLRSNFSIYRIEDDAVFIVDNDIGMSVTNDAENVVEHLLNIYPNKRIFYRDTEGDWSELVHNNKEFVRFAPYSYNVS